MPRSLISAEELQKLLVSILTPGQAEYAVALLQSCHDAFKCPIPPSVPQGFFEKGLTYRGFEVHVPYFQVVDDSVKLASIQFKRKSRFPAPFVNRNAALVREIRRVIDAHYGPGISNYVKDEQGGQFHYLPDGCRFACVPFEDWGSQCAIYDEPYSSGQTSPEETSTRNDFVVVRFNRDAQEDWSSRLER